MVKNFEQQFSVIQKKAYTIINCNKCNHAILVCMLGNVFMLLLSSDDFFSKLTISKNSLRIIIRVSDRLDPDQVRTDIGRS